MNGVNSKVEPLNQYHGVYKAKEFDSPEIIDEEDTTETDDKPTHPDFKPVPFYSLVKSHRTGSIEVINLNI